MYVNSDYATNTKIVVGGGGHMWQVTMPTRQDETKGLVELTDL